MPKQDYIDLLCDLIAIPSLSGGEGAATARVAEFLKHRAVPFDRIGNNIVIRNKSFDRNKKTIILNSHLDTVKPNNSWTYNPFSPTIENGRLYGLGANDAGGALVSLLAAFMEFYDEQIPYNLMFIASAEEENSGDGGIRKVLPVIDADIDLAIVGEPTEMHVALAEKGLLVIDATAYGEAGHAARPNGKNAIDIAVGDVVAINQLWFDRVSDLLGPVVKSVTMINAGSQHNVIPDSCTFVIDVRINELYSLKEVFDSTQNVCRSELRARSFKNNPSRLSAEHPFQQVIQELQLHTFGSPTLSDQTNFNCPSIKIGPGKSERSHTADEFIYLDEIETGIDIYVSMLRQYFSIINQK